MDGLRADDPEGLAGTYAVAQREHATEIASRIIHGDLNHCEPPPVPAALVRPVPAYARRRRRTHSLPASFNQASPNLNFPATFFANVAIMRGA